MLSKVLGALLTLNISAFANNVTLNNNLIDPFNYDFIYKGGRVSGTLSPQKSVIFDVGDFGGVWWHNGHASLGLSIANKSIKINDCCGISNFYFKVNSKATSCGLYNFTDVETVNIDIESCGNSVKGLR